MTCKCGEQVEAVREKDRETGVGYWFIKCPGCGRTAQGFGLQEAVKEWERVS